MSNDMAGLYEKIVFVPQN